MNPRILLFVATVILSACASETPSTSAAPAVAPSPATSDPSGASPWDAARARGIGFRGIGNEPGWLVEVGADETPALHAELDYGERKVDVARMQPLSGILGYAGMTTEGVEVKLHLRREDCSDGMSDNTYPVSARLIVGDKTYAGCGRFPQE
ncbi:MAG TPA: hypothetical protein VIT22_08070 [Pseudoxanthomonas sp.]